MAEKAKTAAERALERFDGQEIPEDQRQDKSWADDYFDSADQFESTKTEDGKVGITRDQVSHVLNQDEVTGFDENKQSERFASDKQTFTRIKDVRAEGPEIVIEIDQSKTDFSIHAAYLTTQRVSPKEAMERAVALNQLLMLDKVNLGDRQQVQDIVEATVEATLEAQENIMRANGATYEDVKAKRRDRLRRIEMFEHAVREQRGQKALDELQEMLLFKRVLTRLNK